MVWALLKKDNQHQWFDIKLRNRTQRHDNKSMNSNHFFTFQDANVPLEPEDKLQGEADLMEKRRSTMDY